MGRISKGIPGGFAGTVGTVVGSKWRGIEYMRSQPTGGRSNPSTLQLAQRNRFAVATPLQRRGGFLRLIILCV